jgi:hypothetical protein
MNAVSTIVPATSVRRCPDCGGILQSLEPEALTSAEVVSGDAGSRTAASQCLICGYEDTARAAAAHER